MMDWHPHRKWIMLCVVAVVLFGLNTPVMEWARQKSADDLNQTRADVEKAHQNLTQLRDDIITTQKLQKQIDAAEIEKSLEPTDRLRAATIIERRGAESRLSHFTYTLSPETRLTLNNIGAEPHNLARGTIHISADAATDLDAYGFIDGLRHSLPGHLKFQQMTFELIGDNAAPLTAANLHLNLVAEWISNGSAP